MRYIFFGTPDIAVASLAALHAAGHVPELVVTQPDRPAGRGNVLTPPPVKLFAEAHGIPVLQVETMTDEIIAHLRELGEANTEHPMWDCFVLVAFGMILPKKLLDVPRLGVVNMHPSLLPNLRGPSPIRSSLLRNEPSSVGVTVMLIDAKMDHGPILAQRSVHPATWPLYGRELDALLAHEGGTLLAETLPRYVQGDVQPHEQNHAQATYCRFIEKNDAFVEHPFENPQETFVKICAYDVWPGVYTFVPKREKRIRVKLITAHIESDGSLHIDTCIPEGKKEMLWTDFMRSL